MVEGGGILVVKIFQNSETQPLRQQPKTASASPTILIHSNKKTNQRPYNSERDSEMCPLTAGRPPRWPSG